MKAYFLPLILILFLQCKEQVPTQTYNCNEFFDLKEGESASVICKSSDERDDSFKVLIKELDIEDSRCCGACICITAGEVKAKISLAAGNSREVVELVLGKASGEEIDQDSKIIKLNNRSIELVLREVNPFPMTPEDATKQQTAKLQLRY